MAGVKGRSGGPRPNSGGARPGAGRKPKPKPAPAVTGIEDALEFMRKVLKGEIQPTKEQVRVAVALAQYQHMKKGDGGKKDEAAGKAKKAAAGRFAAAPAPLALVKR